MLINKKRFLFLYNYAILVTELATEIDWEQECETAKVNEA